MWSVIRKGTEVQVCTSEGFLIASVGDREDFRVNKKLNDAVLLAAAPEMLEVLIDIQELLKRHYFVEDHPVVDSVKKRCSALIDKSMKLHGEKNENRIHHRDDSLSGHRSPQRDSEDLAEAKEKSYAGLTMDPRGSDVFCESLVFPGSYDPVGGYINNSGTSE